MSDKFSNIKSERLRQHFEKQEQEFTYAIALMKAGIYSRLLFICDLPFQQRSPTIVIKIPLLQIDTEMERLARADIFAMLKHVGLAVQSSTLVDNFASFVIDASTVTLEKIKAFQENHCAS